MCCHFLGQALEKAGGKDFRKEIDDLSKEHGNLDTAGGKGAYIDVVKAVWCKIVQTIVCSKLLFPFLLAIFYENKHTFQLSTIEIY